MATLLDNGANINAKDMVSSIFEEIPFLFSLSLSCKVLEFLETITRLLCLTVFFFYLEPEGSNFISI